MSTTSRAGSARDERDAVFGDEAREDSAPVPEQAGPLYYLGLRRAWWVVVCVVLLSAVDALPTVGPYLALAVLMWLAVGLAKAGPKPERESSRVARPVPRRSRRADSGSALPSS